MTGIKILSTMKEGAIDNKIARVAFKKTTAGQKKILTCSFYIVSHIDPSSLISLQPGVIHTILDVVGKLLAGSDSQVGASDDGAGDSAA